ncbi:hypothetical protein B0H14DRAFT_3620035 [Mycena olivaceomarginata]|nr:hypothetical protein B0H14DRAFT_3620035 [Mycena olivaceomarginata]
MYTSLVERRLARPRGPRSAFQNILGYLLDRLGGSNIRQLKLSQIGLCSDQGQFAGKYVILRRGPVSFRGPRRMKDDLGIAFDDAMALRNQLDREQGKICPESPSGFSASAVPSVGSSVSILAAVKYGGHQSKCTYLAPSELRDNSLGLTICTAIFLQWRRLSEVRGHSDSGNLSSSDVESLKGSMPLVGGDVTAGLDDLEDASRDYGPRAVAELVIPGAWPEARKPPSRARSGPTSGLGGHRAREFQARPSLQALATSSNQARPGQAPSEGSGSGLNNVEPEPKPKPGLSGQAGITSPVPVAAGTKSEVAKVISPLCSYKEARKKFEKVSSESANSPGLNKKHPNSVKAADSISLRTSSVSALQAVLLTSGSPSLSAWILVRLTWRMAWSFLLPDGSSYNTNAPDT